MCVTAVCYIATYNFLYFSGATAFTPEDAFIGYQSDTPASIVFKVQEDVKLSEDDDQWEEKVILIVSRVHNNY